MLIKFINHDNRSVYINAKAVAAIIYDGLRPELVKVYMYGATDDEDYFHVKGDIDEVAAIINESLTSTPS